MFGQRELFHSNLLAWFFDALPTAADRVFGELTVAADSGDDRSARREEEKIDLMLRWPDKAPLAIENKVFSLPDMSQLDRYSDVLDKRRGVSARRVLLSASGAATALHADATDGALPILPNGWRVLTYGQLAARIESALGDAPTDYSHDTMRHYASIARHIDTLVSATAVESDEETAWLPSSALRLISSPQVQQALMKVRARRVAERISEEYPDGWAGATLLHAQPLVEWRVPAERDGARIEVGWQYQEGDLRRYVIAPHLTGRGKDARLRREEWADRYPDLFDFQPLEAALGGNAVIQGFRGGGSYGHFDPDFLYQRVRRNDLTVRQLLEVTRTLLASVRSR